MRAKGPKSKSRLRSRRGDADAAVTTRSAILSHYAQVARSMRLDVAAMLRRVGLDAMCLIDPNMQISAMRAVELIERSAMEAGSPVFGIRLALARGVPDLGPLNLLLREEPTLRSALQSLHNYLHLHSSSVRFVVQEEGGVATVSVVFMMRSPLPHAAPQSTEMVVCGALQTIRWMMGQKWSPTAVCFSHPAPAGVGQHRTLLGCPVLFAQAIDGLTMPRADLDRPIATSNPVVRRYAEEYVRSLAVPSAADFQAKVTALIATLLPTGGCSACAVARRLGVNRSTMTRRLSANRHSYSSLLQGTRVTLASRACLSGWPLAEVAQQLGFADLSTFSRWFAFSFGCSASTWRKRELNARRRLA